MQLDTNLPLQATQPDPLMQKFGQAMTLADLMDKRQMNRIAIETFPIATAQAAQKTNLELQQGKANLQKTQGEIAAQPVELETKQGAVRKWLQDNQADIFKLGYDQAVTFGNLMSNVSMDSKTFEQDYSDALSIARGMGIPPEIMPDLKDITIGKIRAAKDIAFTEKEKAEAAFKAQAAGVAAEKAPLEIEGKILENKLKQKQLSNEQMDGEEEKLSKYITQEMPIYKRGTQEGKARSTFDIAQNAIDLLNQPEVNGYALQDIQSKLNINGIYGAINQNIASALSKLGKPQNLLSPEQKTSMIDVIKKEQGNASRVLNNFFNNVKTSKKELFAKYPNQAQTIEDMAQQYSPANTIIQPKSKAEYDAIPSGTVYVDVDGSTKRKK